MAADLRNRKKSPYNIRKLSISPARLSPQHPSVDPVLIPELSMGWVDPRVGLGWAGLGWVEILAFWWVGLGRG